MKDKQPSPIAADALVHRSTAIRMKGRYSSGVWFTTLLGLAILSCPDPGAAECEFGISANHNIYNGNPRIDADIVKRLGATCIYLETKWAVMEPSKGEFDFSETDRQLKLCQALGLSVSLRVKTGAGFWATGPRQHKASRIMMGTITSEMPLKMSDYTEYLTAMVRHYRELGVKQYAIQNEIDDPDQWPGTPEEYHQLLVEAYKAIKSADPAALVVDNGFSSTAMENTTARWLYEHGQEREGYDFYRVSKAAYRDSAQTTMEEFLRYMKGNLWMIRPYQFLVEKEYFKLNRDCYDCLQIHLYGDWSKTPQLLQWIQARMREAGPEKSIVGWESGVHLGHDRFTPEQNAEELVKKFATGAAFGLRQLMYLETAGPSPQWENIENRFGKRPFKMGPLVEYDQGQWRLTKIGRGYAMMTHALQGMTRMTPVTSLADVTAYRVEVGAKTRWLMWASEQPQRVSAAQFTGAVSWLDLNGNPIEAIGGKLPLSTSPVFGVEKEFPVP
jgi:hypothetical protein